MVDCGVCRISRYLSNTLYEGPVAVRRSRLIGRGNILFKTGQVWYYQSLVEKQSSDNKLREFFMNAVRQSFWQLGIYDATVAGYVADVLTDFARTDSLYRLRSRAGRKIESVVEMLTHESELPASENQLLRERETRKYVGDYALFMSGIFRTYVEGRGFLDYYIKEGSRSYWTVSELDVSLYRTGFILFQELSTKFEYYSGALDYTRKAYFAAQPGEDPFAGFLRQVDGWMKVNLTEN
jgi:hypothetical protein